MAINKKSTHVQAGLFEGAVACPDVHNLPWIVESFRMHDVEVRAPGSVYQPVLLSPHQENIDVGPGKLDPHEEQFVRDMVNYLYPSGGHPWSEHTPLKWGEREIWFKRNIEKRKDSFCLRVDDSDWFYPDFIIWILDHATRTQTFGFVDPKGLLLGAGKGWADYKIVSTLYMPHVVERQLADTEQQVEYLGEKWTFRIRGVLVSTTSFDSLCAQAKFKVTDENGKPTAPNQEDFKRGRIVFQQKNEHSYIKDVLELLTTDSVLDDVLKRTAVLFDKSHAYFMPESEADYDLLIRQQEQAADVSESSFVESVVLDYLKRKDWHATNAALARKRSEQLVHYAKEGGVLGFGAEKGTDIRDHQTPCAELWQRIQKGQP